MRNVCLDTVYELARSNPRVVFIGSDLAAGTLDRFKNEMPERFFMEGISEGHLVGMASGLAMSGKLVYLNTIAVFLTRRCFEQNIIDLGLGRANVRLIGNGGGLVYGPLGPTHLAVEDLAIMRTIPNMTVLTPADAVEMKRAIQATEHHSGPVYIRVAKGGDPIVTGDVAEFCIGRAVVLRESTQCDLTFLTTGVMSSRCLDAATQLLGDGVRARVVHFHSIKPMDISAIIESIDRSHVLITVEEHFIQGGLGSAVAEVVAEYAWRKAVVFKRLGLPDAFVDRYGSQEQLLAHYGLDANSIAVVASRLVRQAAF